MIPLTAQQQVILQQAQEILADKATRPETGGGLALAVHDGIKLVLKCSQIVEDVAAVPVPIGPTGEPPESPGEQQGPSTSGLWGQGPPPKLPGIPFQPKHPTTPKAGEPQ